MTQDVTNQGQCQQRCESKSNCVGISYSQLVEKAHWCAVCYDDDLESSGYDFGFYRRPGITLC